MTNILKQLADIANSLDQKGLYKLAEEVDSVARIVNIASKIKGNSSLFFYDKAIKIADSLIADFSMAQGNEDAKKDTISILNAIKEDLDKFSNFNFADPEDQKKDKEEFLSNVTRKLTYLDLEGNIPHDYARKKLAALYDACMNFIDAKYPTPLKSKPTDVSNESLQYSSKAVSKKRRNRSATPEQWEQIKELVSSIVRNKSSGPQKENLINKIKQARSQGDKLLWSTIKGPNINLQPGKDFKGWNTLISKLQQKKDESAKQLADAPAKATPKVQTPRTIPGQQHHIEK